MQENQETICSNLKELYRNVSKNIQNCQIPLSFVDDKIIERENDLEVLFGRITTGGTQITQAELAYSTIKVCFDGTGNDNSVKTACENAATNAHGVSDYLLALITIRLYLMNKGEWLGNVSISKIHDLSKDNEDNEDKKNIKELFGKMVKNVEVVAEIFKAGEIPSPICADLAQKTTDLYLLLLWIVNKYPDFVNSNKIYLCAIAFYLKWFVINGKFGEFAKAIFDKCKNEISKQAIETAILETSAKTGNLLFLCKPENFWDSVNSDFQWYFIRDPRKFPDFLLYAERNHFNVAFSNFKPSIKNIWSEHNRPWDYDHIIPANWIYNKKSGNSREFCRQWYCTVGNFSAIPFEENRSKRDSEDWEYYEKERNKENLMFNDEIKNISNKVIYDEEMANNFVELTKKRCRKIYSKVFGFFNNFELFKSVSDDSIVAERKKMFGELKKLNSFAKICFLNGFDGESNIAWAHSSISIEFYINLENFVLVLGYEQNALYLGICDKGSVATDENEKVLQSKVPNLGELFTNRRIEGRWYAWNQIEGDIYDVRVVSNKLNDLIKKLKPTQQQ